MSSSKVNFLPKSTVELEITITWDEVKTLYETIFNQVAAETEVSGFRKGKAPKHLLDEKIDKTKVYQEVIKQIIPKAYTDQLKAHNLNPLTTPKIVVSHAKENEDWVVKAMIALKPKINLKNYREKIKELKKGKTKIWTPGTDNKKEQPQKLPIDDLINTLLTEVEVELSDLLIDEETNRLLASLIDQTQKLGLTIEKYLLAKGKTIDQIKNEYAKQASRNLTIEFVLSEIADRENITVSQQDLDSIISKAEKEEERENLKKDSYYLAHLLRQQKTLDFLNNL